MVSVAAQLLARTSSASSVCSDDSLLSSDTSLSLGPADPIVDGPKRTRKRFTSLQLMMLEHLYHKASHPTREQREQLAKDADISDVRSVTVWFQNKRQTDRRIHRQLSEPASLALPLQTCSSPAASASTALPPSSPFSDASGKTIHTLRARTRTLSGTSAVSTTSLPTSSSLGQKREREHDSERLRSVRHKPSRHLSLDEIAARTERHALVPRSPPPHCPSSPFPVRPRTPGSPSEEDAKSESGERALWENMQSSPAAPEPASRTERDLVRYGRRKYTLEYACAKEMVGGRRSCGNKAKLRRQGQDAKRISRNSRPASTAKGLVEWVNVQQEFEDDQQVPVLEWDADLHGDTDTEGVPSEVVTPSSSFGIGGLSVADDEENVTASKVDPEVPTGKIAGQTDDERMDVAYALCGLSQRR
ncbi:hypothetical protein BC628DRAFT_905989 [Trametes gibbosa]|nr:hypothetical protein BC628DRAFT_905989 [Trametes gibbosa]